MIRKSIGGSRFQKILSLVTIIASTLLISCMLNITLGIGNQIAKDLRSYGSNIVVLPKGTTLSVEVGDEIFAPLQSESYLEESRLHLIKEIFWRNNITAFAPFLDLKVSNSSLGMQFRTCENFGDFADSKSSLNPQNSHKYKSHTANTRIDSNTDSTNTESNSKSQNLNAESTTQSNNRSNGGVASSRFDAERAKSGVASSRFDAERAKIGLGRPLSEVSHQNDSNEYPRTNCEQDNRTFAIFSGTYFDKLIGVQDEPEFSTGVKMLYPAWSVEGEWVADDSLNSVLVGSELAKRENIKIGDTLILRESTADSRDSNQYHAKVSGILSNSGVYDNRIVGSLALAQKLMGKDNIFAKAEVSAFTIPENTLSYKARRNLDGLNDVEFDTWYCSAFASSIAYQIEEDFKGASAKAQIKVSDAESSIVRKIQGLMGVTSIICLLVASVGIGALLSAEFQRRRKEIGLMKVLGANLWQIYAIFAGESCVIAIFGAIIGFFGGVGVAELISLSIFAHALPISWIALPLSIAFALFISLCGSLMLLKNINALLPANVLYGR
ncbi:ABC transporter permease [Helicobacter sp. 23-1045]